jgi:hypothetical protein
LDEFTVAETERSGNTRLLDLSGTEHSGSQAYESTYYEYGENSTSKSKSIFTLKDDQIYRINFAADAESYKNYIPMAEEMMRSFQFINDESAN